MFKPVFPKYQRLSRFGAGVGAVLTAIVLLCPPAEAMQKTAFSMEILVDGVVLSELPFNGSTYVEALRGKEYTIRLRNHTGRRVAIALAVDGLNSIDAKTSTAEKATKWVLGPYQSVTIDGWQTSQSSARRFFFTTEEQSYGAWLGRTANLGVIEAVVFAEKAPLPMIESSTCGKPGAARQSPAGAPRAAEKKSEGEALSDDLAATGIGRRVNNPVRRVHLDLEEKPAAHLRLRYEYRKQLVHLGVLPSEEETDALARRERAHGFSGFEFAPGPGGAGR
jgi:hypothetical protein